MNMSLGIIEITFIYTRLVARQADSATARGLSQGCQARGLLGATLHI